MSGVDKWLEWTENCKYLPEQELKRLTDKVSEILIEEPNALYVSSPVIVCGDIHGQYYDLQQLFRTGGPIATTKYVFMGDYVDRGYYSVETITQLLTLKLRYPGQLTLLRGNHECRQITQTYGFHDECLAKYGNASVWKRFCQVFDLLPIVAIIDDEIMCVHGGLSPFVSTIDQVRTIERNCEIPYVGAFCDLVWSDPEESIKHWSGSPRGAGWLFGEVAAFEFLQINNLELICRAHQLIHEGVRYMFNSRLVTVWSAPNYCYRCGNVASILVCEAPTKRVSRIFSAVPDAERSVPRGAMIMPYFL